MKTITVKTGFGYYTDKDNHIIAKAELPKGKHKLSNDLSYIEVADKTTLDKITVWQKPLSVKQVNEQKIAQENRKLAVDSLIAKGKLEQGYK